MKCPIPSAWPQTITTNGVWPLLREQGCTHQNLETPRLLRSPGLGRVVVDVGLGFDAVESKTALDNGFHVLGIEPSPANVAALRRRFAQDQRVVFLPSDLTLSDLQRRIGRLGFGAPKLLILMAGAGSYDGRMAFSASETPSYVGGHVAGSRGAFTTTVPVYRLQTLLQRLPSAFMLKIDVQGYELRVLEGIDNDVAKIQYIQYEFSPWLMRRDGMIDSGAIPIIKGNKALVDTPPQQSIMDYLDLIGKIRKVFIDLGANCGNSFHKIKQNPRNKILNGGGWETFLWEANPTLVRLWLMPLAKSDPTITIIPKVASNRSGNASFYLTRGQESAVTKNDFHGSECDPNKEQNPSGASSLLSSVPRAGIPIRVEVVDFAAWLKRMKLRPSDTVVLKIDIEGSEFDVLSNLENTNTICLIDEFLIEWHTSHFKENERDRAFRFRETFSKRFYARCGAQPVVNAWH